MGKIQVGDFVTPKKQVRFSYRSQVCNHGEKCYVVSTPCYTNRSGTFLYCRAVNGGHELHVDREDMQLMETELVC